MTQEITQHQNDIKALKEHLKGKNPTYHIRTYGCQMNVNDSAHVAGILESCGYTHEEDIMKSDIAILNTCCVRENAENKVFGQIGNLKSSKQKNKDMMIIVMGCIPQQKDMADHMSGLFPYVDIITGANNMHALPHLILERLEEKHQIKSIVSPTIPIKEDLPIIRQGRVSEFVTIMTGCNNFCSYCAVPHVRGRERSRQLSDILSEIHDLTENGCKEVVLLGQNVNSYGLGLDSELRFPELLKHINNESDVERIRFMTSHPKDLSDELIDAIATLPKMCHHVHLPMQSGSDAILERMNRKYTAEHYLGIVNKLKSAVPDIALTTDIIVGFPGESDEDFRNTMAMVEEVRYHSAFMFKYSKRRNTPAATFGDQVDEEVKKHRLDELIATQEAITQEMNRRYIGTVQEVLVEGMSARTEGAYTGKTSGNITVNFPSTENLVGRIVPILVKDSKSHTLSGELA